MGCADIDAVWKLLGNPAIRCEVILTEFAQPGGTGRSIAFLERLRADPARKHVQVIIYTATVDPVMRDRALRLGLRQFIAKPFSLEALVATLNQIDGELSDIEPIEDLADAARRRGVTVTVLTEEIASFLFRAQSWMLAIRKAAEIKDRADCAATARTFGKEGAAVGLREVARQLREIAGFFSDPNCPVANLLSRLQAVQGELAQTGSILDL